jgi:hypothetical protein
VHLPENSVVFRLIPTLCMVSLRNTVGCNEPTLCRPFTKVLFIEILITRLSCHRDRCQTCKHIGTSEKFARM